MPILQYHVKLPKSEKWPNQVNLKMFKCKECHSRYFSNMKSIKRNRQFQVTKLSLIFPGILIQLTDVNNIQYSRKILLLVSEKKDSKVFNVPSMINM